MCDRLFFYDCWLGKYIFMCLTTKLTLTSCRCSSVNHLLQFDIYTLCKWKWEVVNLHDDAAKGVNLGSTGEMNGTSCWSVINHLWLTHSAGRLQFCCTRAGVHDSQNQGERYFEKGARPCSCTPLRQTRTLTHARVCFFLSFIQQFHLTWLLHSQQCSIVMRAHWVPARPIYLNQYQEWVCVCMCVTTKVGPF